MSSTVSRQLVEASLHQPPEVVNVGHRLHGVRELVEHWLLPELYAVHLYDWTGELKIGETLHQIRPGDLSIIPPNTPMEYRYVGPSRHISAHIRLNAEGPRVRIPAVQALGADLHLLRDRLTTASATTEPRQRVAEVWAVLWSAATRSATSTSSSKRPHPAVLTAVGHIDQHLSDSLRVHAIADTAAVSISHLNRLFVATYGIGVAGYIRDRRVERARHLLRDTTQPITAVALGVGIPDLQAFNKFCRAHLGAAPRAIRLGNQPPSR